MATTLMRCTTPHWQGNTFVDVGEILPAGHRKALPEFFELYDVGEAAEDDVDLDALRAKAEAAGVKVDKRWGADRLYEEIAAAKSEDDESE